MVKLDMDIILHNLDTLPLWKDKDESWLRPEWKLNGLAIKEFAAHFYDPWIIDLQKNIQEMGKTGHLQNGQYN